MKRRPLDRVLLTVGICLLAWAICVALVLLGRAAVYREQPDRQLYNWASRLSGLAAHYHGLEAAWGGDVLAELWDKKDRPYEQLLLTDPQGQVIAGFPEQAAGANIRDMVVGDQKIMLLADWPHLAYARRAEPASVAWPYSSRWVVADDVDLWQSSTHVGRLIALRPALVLGKPWIGQLPHVGALSVIPFGLGVLAFAGYWVLLAIWLYQEARRQGRPGLIWGVAALVGNVVAVLFFLATRPGAQCNSCQQALTTTWRYCPHCGTAHP